MSKKNKKSLLSIILLITIMIVSYKTKNIILLILLGLGIGIILTPPVRYLRSKFNLNKYVLIMILLGVAFLFSSLIVFTIGYSAIDQVAELSSNSASIKKSIDQKATEIIRLIPFIDNIKDVNAQKYIEKIVTLSTQSFKLSFSLLTGLIFSLIIGVYIAVDYSNYKELCLKLLPKKNYNYWLEIIHESVLIIRKWFNAQALDMLIIGLITTSLLFIFNIQYWAIFGLLTMFLTIIPYVGIVTTVLFASAITMVTDPGKVKWVILIYIFTQFIEGNFILPKVMKDKINIPEAVLITMMLVFGFWFGLLGVLIAPACTGILMMLIEKNTESKKIDS